MLIELDLRVDDVSTLAGSERIAIESIGQAIFRGRHIVTSDVRVLDEIARQAWLSEMSSAAFRAARQRAGELRAIPRPDFKLIANRAVDLPVRDGLGWIVPLQFLASVEFSESQELLAENLNDADVYLEMARILARRSGYRGLDVSLRKVGCGGSTTPVEVRRRCEERRWFVCVVDSDKSSETAPIGNLAARCLELVPEITHDRDVVVLPVRMIENFIPLSWLRHTQVGKQYPGRIDQFDRAETEELVTIRFFSSLKDAFLACKVVAGLPGTAKLATELELLTGIDPFNMQRCAGECDGRSCLILHGVGGSVPAQIMEVLYHMPKSEHAVVENDVMLRRVLTRVLERGLAVKPMRV